MTRALTSLICLGAVLTACKPANNPDAGLPFAPAGPDASPDPSKMGPYPVGVVTYEGIYDDTRTDQWGNPRHLVTEVWYPATDAARGQPGKSYNVEDLMTDQQRTIIQMNGIKVPLDTTVAVENAEPRLEGGPYPLVVFSHGQAGIRWQSTYYTVQLASHGYVVVAPDHPGDTLQDAFDLGTDPPLTTSYAARELDVAYLISYFSCIQNVALTTAPVDCIGPDDLMNGMILNGKDAPIGVTGHSFGALTAIRAGFMDPRVKAIVPQAPTSAGEALIDQGAGSAIVKTPSLIEGSGKDHTLEYYCQNAGEAYTQMTKPRALMDIDDGGHFTYSDLCRFNLGSVANGLGIINVENVITDGCGPTDPSASVADPIINNYAIGFLNWQLRGSQETMTKYLTQAAGSAISPDSTRTCTPDPSCQPGLACCEGDASNCCVLESSTPSAGQGTCNAGESCNPMTNLCEVVEFTSDF